MLTMPEDLLAEVDRAARHRNQNRSEFVRAALHNYLEQLSRAEFEALLAEGYRETARAAAELVEESLPLQSEAATGAWADEVGQSLRVSLAF